MYVSKLKQHNNFLRKTDGILFANPIVSGGFALPFIVMGTVDTRAAVAISVTMLFINIIVAPLAVMIKKQGHDNAICMIVSMITASLLVVAASYAVKEIHLLVFELMGIYFPLLAVNTLTFFIVSRIKPERKIIEAELSAIRHSIGFAMVAIPISAFREFFGKGSIYGIKIAIGVQVPSVLLPFFGFILVGMFCAACRYADRLWKSRLLSIDRAARLAEQQLQADVGGAE